MRTQKSASRQAKPLVFPFDPLKGVTVTEDDRRRIISGILESYNSTYDVLVEAVQNAVDAVEDASLLKLKGPYAVHVTVNLVENWISVLDTGVGMTPAQVERAFAPHTSFKPNPEVVKQRGRVGAYRGYKGVGLTFLAYGSDDASLHAKQDGILTKGRMQYGRAWANGQRETAALVTEDEAVSPLEKLTRGVYLRVAFSESTRPKSLNRMCSNPQAWVTILRTRTGRVPLDCCCYIREGPSGDRERLILEMDPEIRTVS